jgi:hypothetical protein
MAAGKFTDAIAYMSLLRLRALPSDADILWRHDQGDVMTWEMENGAVAADHDFGAVANAWQIVRTGEFDLV